MTNSGSRVISPRNRMRIAQSPRPSARHTPSPRPANTLSDFQFLIDLIYPMLLQPTHPSHADYPF